MRNTYAADGENRRSKPGREQAVALMLVAYRPVTRVGTVVVIVAMRHATVVVVMVMKGRELAIIGDFAHKRPCGMVYVEGVLRPVQQSNGHL